MTTVKITVTLFNIPDGDDDAAAVKIEEGLSEVSAYIEDQGLSDLNNKSKTLFDADGDDMGTLNVFVENVAHEHNSGDDQ